MLLILFSERNLVIQADWSMRKGWDPNIEYLNFFGKKEDFLTSKFNQHYSTYFQSQKGGCEGLLGLMQLANDFNYFIGPFDKNGERKIVNLTGFGASLKRSLDPTWKAKDLQWKYLSYLYNHVDKEKRLDFLADSARRAYQLYPDFEYVDIDEGIKREFYNFHFPNDICNINGRKVDLDPHSVLHALLSERQAAILFESLNISEKYLYQPPVTESLYKIETLNLFPKLISHGYNDVHQVWPSTPNINNADPIGFLCYNSPEPSVDIELFLFLNSPETPAILEKILNEELEAVPFSYRVYLLGDLNNETSKRIIYSFSYAVEFLGMRNACDYLLSGYKHGFKIEYELTYPPIKWNHIPRKLYNESSQTSKNIKKIFDYADRFNITKNEGTINGTIITKKPLLLEIKRSLVTFSDWQRVYYQCGVERPPEGVEIQSFHPPVEISRKNWISIDRATIPQIRQILSLFTNDIVHVFHDTDNLPFEIKKILHINGPTTIVGPLSFQKVLSESEVKFVKEYVNQTFLHSVTETGISQVMFIMLWRSTLGLNGVQRSQPYDSNSKVMMSYYALSPLTWTIVLDPFSDKFRSIIELARRCHLLGICRVKIIPSVSLQEYDTFPAVFNEFYYHVFDDHSYLPDVTDLSLHMPDSWSWERSDGIVKILGVTSPGYSDSEIVGDKATVNDGFFLQILPFGQYELKGIEWPFIVDTFVPTLRWYPSSSQITNIEYDRELTIMMINENDRLTRATINSILIQRPNVHFLVISPLQRTVNNTVSVPFYRPPFMKKTNMSLFTLSNIYLPVSCSRVILSKCDTFYTNNFSIVEKEWDQRVVFGMPLSSRKSNYKHLKERYGRSAHDDDFVVIDMRKWREVKGGEIYRRMIDTDINIINPLYDILQLQVQVATMPKLLMDGSEKVMKEFIGLKNSALQREEQQTARNFYEKMADL